MTRVLRFISASAEISKGVKRATDILQQIALEGTPRGARSDVAAGAAGDPSRAWARIFHGDTHVEDKVLSVFEPPARDHP